MTVTPFEDIPRVYLTMGCNYKCQYCPQVRPPKMFARRSGAEWVERMNSFDSDCVVVGGGEPTIHGEFIKIVNGIDRKKEVRIYSNMSFSDEMILRMTRPLAWYSSFHPSGAATADDVIRRLNLLLIRGHKLINVHVNVAEPSYLDAVEYFNKNGYPLQIERNLFDADKWQELKKIEGGKVVCRLRRTYIGPDCQRYICVHKLEHGDPTGIVDHMNPVAELPCDVYGDCSVCDASLISVEPRA